MSVPVADEAGMAAQLGAALGQDGGKKGDLCLKSVMDDLKLKCLVPRKRVNVMLVGNHSAGKSTTSPRSFPRLFRSFSRSSR